MTESVNPACFITVVCLTSLYLNFAFSMYFLIKTVTFISKETSVFFLQQNLCVLCYLMILTNGEKKMRW